MATFKAVLKSEVRKTDKAHLVLVRIIAHRKTAHLGTGIYITKAQWNEEGSLNKADWIRKHPLKNEFNQLIKDRILEGQSLGLKHPSLDAAALKEKLTIEEQPRPEDFTGFFAQEIERRKVSLKAGTIERYSDVLKALKTYLQQKPLPFDRLSKTFVLGYEKHLLTTRSKNTAIKHLSIIRTVLQEAIMEGYLPKGDDPFKGKKMSMEKGRKAKLTAAELKAIAELELPAKGRLRDTRTAFLLQFYMAGMRIGDLLQLRWEMIRGNRLEYRMQKTAHQATINLHPQALALIEPYKKEKGYILPFLPEDLQSVELQAKVESMTAVINKYLRELATMAKIEKKVTTHVARHSFASLAWETSGNLQAVSEALGHSNMKTTEVYLRELSEQEKDSLLEQTFKLF